MKLSCYVLYVALLVCAALLTNASAQQLSEDFDSLTAGQFPPGWVLMYNGYGTEYQIVDTTEYVSAPQALKMEGRTNWAGTAVLFLPYTTSRIRIEVDVLPTEVDVPSFGNHIAVVRLGSTSTGPCGAELHFGPSYSGSRLHGRGVWDHWTGPVYEQGVWHHVDILADLDMGLHSVYFDYEPLYLDEPMDDATNGYEYLALEGGNSCHTRVWFDNLVVSWELPAPVEPASWTSIKAMYR